MEPEDGERPFMRSLSQSRNQFPGDASYEASASTSASASGQAIDMTSIRQQSYPPNTSPDTTIDFDAFLDILSSEPAENSGSSAPTVMNRASATPFVDLTDDADPPPREVITIESDDDEETPIQRQSRSAYTPHLVPPDYRTRPRPEEAGSAIWNLFSSWRSERPRMHAAVRTRRHAMTRAAVSPSGGTGMGGIGTDSPEAMRGLLSHYLPMSPLYHLVHLHQSHHHHHHHPYLSQTEAPSTLVEPKYKQPKPAREGYTRDITSDTPPPLCTSCARPLGVTDRTEDEQNTTADSIIMTTLNSHRMHAVRCGHVFCGDCIVAIKAAKKCSLCNRRINKPSEVIECFV